MTKVDVALESSSLPRIGQLPYGVLNCPMSPIVIKKSMMTATFRANNNSAIKVKVNR